jgi:hypothetical protein
LPEILRKRPPEVGAASLDTLDSAVLEDALKTTDGRLDFG